MRDMLHTHDGERFGTRRLRRFMREGSLWRLPHRKRRHRWRRVSDEAVPDLVRRDFMAPQPNAICITDLLEFRTAEGKL